MAKQYKAIGTVIYGKNLSAAHGAVIEGISAEEAAELVKLGAAEEIKGAEAPEAPKKAAAPEAPKKFAPKSDDL